MGEGVLAGWTLKKGGRTVVGRLLTFNSLLSQFSYGFIHFVNLLEGPTFGFIDFLFPFCFLLFISDLIVVISFFLFVLG